MRKFPILLGFWVCLIVASIAHARPCNLGRVEAVYGGVTMQRGTLDVRADTDIILCEGDQFTTDSVGLLQLRFRDDTLITLGRETVFIVKRFKIFKEKANLALFELTKGAFRAVTGAITKRRHRFEVSTAIATIGVRGTDFWGGYGLTENGFDVLMIDGKGVYVVASNGERVELDQPGLGTTIVAGGGPSAPKKWGDAKVAKAVATITP